MVNEGGILQSSLQTFTFSWILISFPKQRLTKSKYQFLSRQEKCNLSLLGYLSRLPFLLFLLLPSFSSSFLGSPLPFLFFFLSLHEYLMSINCVHAQCQEHDINSGNYTVWINVTNNLSDKSNGHISTLVFLDLSAASEGLTIPSFMKHYLPQTLIKLQWPDFFLTHWLLSNQFLWVSIPYLPSFPI